MNELAQAVRGAADEHRARVDALAAALRRRLEARGIPADESDRMRSAEATLALLSALDDVEEEALVAALAEAEVPTSTVAMGAV